MTPAVRAGDLFAGRFEIEELRGRGGAGAVYRAFDRERAERVALKVLSRHAGEERLLAEASALEALSHPGIVRALGHGVEGGGARWLALEWIEGITLAERIEAGRLAPAEALVLARRAAGALAAAHAAGIVHRDLSPRNVLLPGGALAQAKIVDFGLASTVARLTGSSSGVVGTPGYMAPEQARAEDDVDARADVFALGCLLFECVAGRPPFEAGHALALLAKIVFDEVPRLDALREDVPASLASLVARALAKSREERPADGAALLALLDGVAADAGPAPASGGERRVVAVVLARTPRGARAREVVHALRRSPEVAALSLDVLADGAVIGTSAAAGAGTDLAHGAARGALALHGALGEPVALAIGAGEVGGGLVSGEAIDRAAALLRGARGEGVVVDATTRDLLDDRFELADRGGGAALVGYRAGAAGTLLGRATPFVGRARELDTLLATFEDCIDEERAAAARVTAPAGAGKSRLRRELALRVRRELPGARVLTGRGDALRAGSSFALVGDLVRGALELHHLDPREGRARIEARLGAGTTALFLAELVGLAAEEEPGVELAAARADPILMHDRLRGAFAAWLARELDEGPCLVVLEDAHWGDAPSERFVADALERLEDRPLFVLVLARPDVAEAPAWRLDGATELHLGPLSSKAAGELVDRVLGERAASLRESLVARAAGNAFYLEELMRAVLEGRGDELPATVLATAQARLASLPAPERRALRAASVFGRSFWPGALAAVLGEDERTASELADALVRRELVDARERSADGPRELVFRHDLVREAAYAMLDERGRAAAHASAGSWLEARGGADPLALASHFDRGGLAERACAWYRRAAELALAANDFAAVEERAARAVELGASAEERGGPTVLRAEAARWRGDHARARELAAEATGMLAPGSAAWLRAVSEATTASGRLGDYEAVVRWSALALEAKAEDGCEVALVLGLCAAGRQLFHAGDYARAALALARVRELAPDPDALDPIAAAQAHGLAAAAARHRGDLAGDLDGYRRVLAAAERAGDLRTAVNARVSVAFGYMQLGRFATAEEELVRALADAEAMELDGIATRARQNLALVRLHRGDLSTAASLADRVIAESSAQGNVRFTGWTLIYRAQVALAAGDAGGALAFAREAAALLEPSPPARAGALAVGARALTALGRPSEALAEVSEAMRTLSALGGIEEFESLVRLAHVEALEASGERAARDAALAAARARLEERASAIEDARGRESFLRDVPENARTLALAAGSRRKDA